MLRFIDIAVFVLFRHPNLLLFSISVSVLLSLIANDLLKRKPHELIDCIVRDFDIHRSSVKLVATVDRLPGALPCAFSEAFVIV